MNERTDELTELTPAENLRIALDAQTVSLCEYNEIDCDNTIIFKLGDLKELGDTFLGLSSVFSIMQPTGKLYKAVIPKGCKLAAAKDGSGLLGATIGKKGLVGQARFHEVEKFASTASKSSMLFMALALMAINKSIDNIAQNQKDIISFLETDKKTQVKGDLITLSNTLQDYQHNWDNEQYRKNRDMQVLDIKRSSEQNILFYRDMIDRRFKAKTFIHIDSSKTLNETFSNFRYYKLSLYLYAFSSFLDVVLLENYDREFINTVTSRIKDYENSYNEFYKKSILGAEEYTSSSVQARALQGISVAGKFLGERLSKIPAKNDKLKLGEKLLTGTEKVDNYRTSAINETVSGFNQLEDSGIKVFCDNMKLIDKIYNEPYEIRFDDKYLYLNA